MPIYICMRIMLSNTIVVVYTLVIFTKMYVVLCIAYLYKLISSTGNIPLLWVYTCIYI